MTTAVDDGGTGSSWMITVGNLTSYMTKNNGVTVEGYQPLKQEDIDDADADDDL